MVVARVSSSGSRARPGTMILKLPVILRSGVDAYQNFRELNNRTSPTNKIYWQTSKHMGPTSSGKRTKSSNANSRNTSRFMNQMSIGPLWGTRSSKRPNWGRFLIKRQQQTEGTRASTFQMLEPMLRRLHYLNTATLSPTKISCILKPVNSTEPR